MRGREHGQTRTATDQSDNPWDLTAAHRTLPFGTRVVVTSRRNGHSVTVTINDRGAATWTHRDIDLWIRKVSLVFLSDNSKHMLRAINDAVKREAHLGL